jgi:hypothetical protein
MDVRRDEACPHIGSRWPFGEWCCLPSSPGACMLKPRPRARRPPVRRSRRSRTTSCSAIPRCSVYGVRGVAVVRPVRCRSVSPGTSEGSPSRPTGTSSMSSETPIRPVARSMPSTCCGTPLLTKYWISWDRRHRSFRDRSPAWMPESSLGRAVASSIRTSRRPGSLSLESLRTVPTS